MSLKQRLRPLLGALCVALLVAACGGPQIVIQNRTSFGVRVLIKTEHGYQVRLPSPGGSSAIDVSTGTDYYAAVYLDHDWVTAMKERRDAIVSFLTSGDLTGDQMLRLLAEVKGLAAAVADAAKAGGVVECDGSVVASGEGEATDSVVTVSQASNGLLAIRCD